LAGVDLYADGLCLASDATLDADRNGWRLCTSVDPRGQDSTAVKSTAIKVEQVLTKPRIPRAVSADKACEGAFRTSNIKGPCR
jgi:hypothetical protein